MNQTILDQVTSAVAEYLADHPLERLESSAMEIVVVPASPGASVSTAGHRSEPARAGEALDDLSLATWEDAEWQ